MYIRSADLAFLSVFCVLLWLCAESILLCLSCVWLSSVQQQLQAHQLSQLQGLALPMTPLPLGLSQPTLPAVTTSSGLFSLSSLLASQAQLAKEEKASRDGVDSHREEDGDKSD